MKTSKPIDPTFAPVVAAFARRRDVELAPMFASSGLRTNGKFFAIGVSGELVLKLPAPRVRELLAQKLGRAFRRGEHGPAMKEWIRIPSEAGDWLALSREAYAHASSRPSAKRAQRRA
jgi:hypothetical protein